MKCNIIVAYNVDPFIVYVATITVVVMLIEQIFKRVFPQDL